jgi:hypothetical protein
VANEFVYRVMPDGKIAYKFPMPNYSGTLHDGMVLGEQDLVFATRGSMLIAFSVLNGRPAWDWDSGVPDIEGLMAVAGGGCEVDTSEGIVLVERGVKKGVLAPPGFDMYKPGKYIGKIRNSMTEWITTFADSDE